MNEQEFADFLAAQSDRWRRGDRTPVESWCDLLPTLRDSHRFLLDAIYHEVLLREEDGQRPVLEEYLKRFPHLAEDLRRLFEVHGALADEEPEVPPASTIPFAPREKTTGDDWPDIPGYEVVGELGRGAMGVVYKARQTALNRLVALKLVLAGSAAEADELFLFRREAEALGRLKHPHVVQVYDYGEYDGQPFLAMELVEGTTLEEKLRQEPLDPREAAALVVLLAQGVHAAHTRGLIHRDLKPSNVLLAADGTPRVSDFGLARHVQEEGPTAAAPGSSGRPEGLPPRKPGFSEHKVLGTPAYMAPEQARAESARIGPATDVYALGAILYATLTGRPPQPGTWWELISFLEQGRRPSFPPSRRRDRDLEAVCLKCLALEIEQRYASALELAEDLKRYLDRLPVAARPVGRLQRGRYWCWRNPLLAALAALLLIVIAGGFTGITATMLEAFRQRDAKDIALDEVHKKAGELKMANGVKEAALVKVRQQADDLTKGNAALEEALYLSNLRLAARAMEDGDIAAAQRALAGCAARLRGFEWRYLDRLSRTTERTWRPPPLKGNPRFLAVSPDGKKVVVAGDIQEPFYILDATTGAVLQKLGGQPVLVAWAAFHRLSPNRLVTTDSGSVMVWDTATGKVQATIGLTEIGGTVVAASFLFREPNQLQSEEIMVVTRTTSTEKEGRKYTLRLRVWDLGKGQWVREGQASGNGFANKVMLSAEGRYLAVWEPTNQLPLYSEDVRIIATDTGRDLCTLRGHTGRVNDLAFSRNFNPGRLESIVTAGADRTVRVWDSSGREKLTLLGHRAAVTAVAFSPEGGVFVTAGQDRVIHTWDRSFGRELAVHAGPAGPISALLVGLEGATVGAAAPNGEVTTWSTSRTASSFHLIGMVSSVAMDRTGKLMACGQFGPLLPAVLFDGESGSKVREFPGNEWWGVALNDDGTRLAAASSLLLPGGVGRLWDATTGEKVGDLPRVKMVAYSPDGALLACVTQENGVLLCDGRSGKMTRRLPKEAGLVTALTFGADGRRLAVGLGDGRVLVWDVADGRLTATIQTTPGLAVRSLSLSPDGRAVATCGEDPELTIWDLATGTCQTRWRGPADTLVAVAYNPDGRTLAVAAGDRMVRLLDARGGELLLTLQGAWSHITCLAFSGDGNRLAVGGSSNPGSEVRVWDGRPTVP